MIVVQVLCIDDGYDKGCSVVSTNEVYQTMIMVQVLCTGDGYIKDCTVELMWLL